MAGGEVIERVGRPAGSPARPRRRLAAIAMPEGRVAILVWSYVAIAALVCALTAIVFPVSLAIRLPFSIAGLDPVALGVAAWIVVGLATSSRGSSEEGRATIVFGVAPIIAAMALGGPAAAIWVATVGSLELREVRGDVPWYGVLANRAMLAIPAAAGGIVTVSLRDPTVQTWQLSDFAAVMAGAAVFWAGNLVLALLAVWARTGRWPREALGVPVRTLAMLIVGESTLAWVIAAAYSQVAWWCSIALVAADTLAAASIDRGRAGWMLRHDPLTQLPNHLSLAEHAADLRSSRRTGDCVFYIDLDGFKAVNDAWDHFVGDDVLRIVAVRLGEVKRRDDFVARLHGDEFVLLATGVETEADAAAIVARIERAIEEPIEHEVGTIRVSASVGHRLLDGPDGLEEALRHADHGMATAKRARAAVATAGARRHR